MQAFTYIAAIVVGLGAGWHWRRQAISKGYQRTLVNLLTLPRMLELAGVALVIALMLVPLDPVPPAEPETLFSESPDVPTSVTISAPDDEFPLDAPDDDDSPGDPVEEAV
ncbi:hypothetical protein [uncultured Nevskia sp.]|uniref:hypothetical protein n=1 Tax=uncultured Nevskia sp. TaxID=228950 RepID=UPI0025E2836C|nr:hypothetical protein [uncultured Nevskia sp.]